MFENVTRGGKFTKNVGNESGAGDKKINDDSAGFFSPPKKFKKWILGVIATIFTAVAGLVWEYWRLKQ